MTAAAANGGWGTFIAGVAEPDPAAYGNRAARKGGRYNAFVPPNIADYPFALTGSTARDVEVGTEALTRLRGLNLAPGLHSLAETLLRSESVASSRIEGLDMTHVRLARARYGGGREDKKAREVIANIDAMRTAIELGASTDVLGVDAIREIHRALIRGETLRGKPSAGVVRDEQNWIGGNDRNPVGAIFVPPPPEYVRPLLNDLEQFIARDDLEPLTQAAIAHGQFETIHPFLDGNGRVGRALVYGILRRRGLLGDYIPPISLVLNAAPRSYTSSLAAYQRRSTTSQHPPDLIVQTFAQAAEIASREAAALRDDVAALQGRWREALRGLRSDAAAWKLVDELPGRPVLTAPSVRGAPEDLRARGRPSARSARTTRHHQAAEREEVGTRVGGHGTTSARPGLRAARRGRPRVARVGIPTHQRARLGFLAWAHRSMGAVPSDFRPSLALKWPPEQGLCQAVGGSRGPVRRSPVWCLMLRTFPLGLRASIRCGSRLTSSGS